MMWAGAAGASAKAVAKTAAATQEVHSTSVP